jgi:hypothetical protein
MADDRRSDVRPSVKDRTNRPKGVQPRALPSPLNARVANQQFNFCLGLVQECRRLESALPATDYYDTLATKAA